ncbi:MAG: hypothetical protein H6573_33500 [Lewinellaceae bacterium]|nr:hypothetical protein [Lewinellaceae bacterium]
MKYFKYLTVLAVLACSCQNNSEKWASAKLIFTEIPTPCQDGEAPNLFVSGDGQVYLTWVEFLNDTTDALLFSKLENGQWGKAATIAQGDDWFVNWADFPSLSANGNWLAAHWLQKSTDSTYDYDVRISQSKNGGQWGPSFIPHSDSMAAEHGFVTMFPISEKRMFATWLDGRNTKAGSQSSVSSSQSDNGHGHGGGAMTLRTAEFDRDGNLFEESELDNRICDCCQTDAVLASQGPVVVYRDRSEHEIRDIGIVRKVNGEWTNPHLIHADNWEISGCPVNGPAVAANGDLLAVAWFTSAGGKGVVKVAFSGDAGATFSELVQVDDGNPSGRVDVEFLDNENVLVTWLENTENAAEIRAAITSEKGKEGESMTLVQTSPARSSGFPVLAKNKDHFLLAWTAVDSISTTVKTAKWQLQK